MKLSRKGWYAVGLTAVLFSAGAIAAGNYSTYPIVGSASFCVSTVTGAGGLGGATGQGQATTGSICAQTVPAGPPLLTGAELVPADTGLAGGASPQSVTIPVPLLANFSGTPRNYLENGAMSVQQRGTGIATCAANAAITSAAYSADRWGCSANVGSGAGRTQIVTASPAPPTGFQASVKVYRTSGALTQPVCFIQEISSVRSTYLAGKTVSLSFYADALAGLAADNNNAITASIIYGTGTDEGLGTMTASPAITPAWTGIAFAINQTPITITTTFARYSVTGTIPATATEVGVELCFTPTATGAGVTDGFAVTGVQLEVAPSPSAFEFLPYSQELATAQRYFYRITEGTPVVQRGMCAVSSTSLAVCQVAFPQVMAKVPTMTYTSGFSLTVAAQTSAVACSITRTSTTLTSAAASTQAVPVDCTSSAGFGAAGTAAQLYDAGGSGVITASADF